MTAVYSKLLLLCRNYKIFKMTNTNWIAKVLLSLSILSSFGFTSCKKDQATSGVTDLESQSETTINNAPYTENIAELLQQESGYYVFQLGINQLALKKSTNPEVIALARSIEKDYLKAQDDLMVYAKAQSVSLAEVLPSDKKKSVERLGKESVKSFDQKYVKLIMKEHNDAIDRWFRVYQETKDSELKLWSYKTLDMLRNHLAEAIRIQHSLK